MRRSVREAMVGFTVLAGLASALGLWMWLRGVSLSRNTWRIRASFADAAGLAARSPVSFRGVMVGSVRSIEITDQAVIAELEITDPRLRLSRPVVARVGASSLLGGDAVVSLISSGQPLPRSLPGPRSERCDDKRMVCNGGRVVGVEAASLDSVTETVQRLLEEAEQQKLVPQMVAATRSFDATASEAEQLMQESQAFVRDARRMVAELGPLVRRTDPILHNLNAASADAARATENVKNFTEALDDPRTVADLKATMANAKALTARWEAVGGDVRKLTGDPAFINGIRSVSVGLGRFFEDLYPAATSAARTTAERERDQQEEARRRRQEARERLAPRSR
jgi:phospholipid/cholesterol/gamma-HCH transport system substrate-binding protein